MSAVSNDPAATTASPAVAAPALFSTKRPALGEFVVERVETVAMTDQQYETAVTTLATLIVECANGAGSDGARPGHTGPDR